MSKPNPFDGYDFFDDADIEDDGGAAFYAWVDSMEAKHSYIRDIEAGCLFEQLPLF